ncbi:MAG TPA: ABC transporter ATP-binding protein [Gammaproteobacteria bacterium]|nr:ABC transporter ATP-binding protein [Gammaproteobacteria bacterium]
MNESSIAVEARAATKVFPGKPPVRALDDATIAIRSGEFFTLLGPSGCGKTTLLRLIAGFEQPTRGELFLYGDPLAHLPPFRRPVNTVFQSYALFPHLTVARNIAFGLEMLKLERAKISARVEEMLALVKLEKFGDRRPAQLSGGQQQRVALARALANHPKVLLLDEPLSALDLKLRKEMQLELKRLQLETGITFIFVTHDQEEALTMSDRIAVMRDGHILQIGTPTQIYEHPEDRFVADFIGDSNFLEAECLEANGDKVSFTLAGGGELRAADGQGCAPGDRVTLAVRPERIELDIPDAARVAGRVENVVYFGTDTTYYVTLPGGSRVQIRVQNRTGSGRKVNPGDAVGLAFPSDAVQVLRH